MPNEKVATLPDHLTPLLEPTPSGVAKLVAAWEGLSTELQILILTGLDKAGLPAYLKEKVCIKALDGANAYVRYLAARLLDFSGDDTDEKKAVKQRIGEDPDPLVRYCLLENRWDGLWRDLANCGAFSASDLADADAFFGLPQEARLAKVRSSYGSGTEIANLIGHAVDHQLNEGKVSAIELFEILSDYVNRTEFKKRYGPDNESHDVGIEYDRGKDIDALWRLVLKVPEYISDILIKNLPPGAGLSSGIPEDVLSGMSDGQLTTLFNREDIDLKDLRKKIVFEAGEKRDEVRNAAMLYNFDLDYADFTAILDSPKNVADRIVGDLLWAPNLSLWLYAAIHDVASERDLRGPEDAMFGPTSFSRRREALKGWQREKQLRDLNLYLLTRQAVSWKRGEKGSPLAEELEFLSKAIVEGNIWGTFIAFSNIQKENSPDSQKLNKYLSRIGDPGEDDESGQVDDGMRMSVQTY